MGLGGLTFCLLNHYATTAIQVILNDRNCNILSSLVFFQSTAPKQYTLKVNAYEHEHNNHIEQEDEWDVVG